VLDVLDSGQARKDGQGWPGCIRGLTGIMAPWAANAGNWSTLLYLV
jgi:hypothetical protein